MIRGNNWNPQFLSEAFEYIGDDPEQWDHMTLNADGTVQKRTSVDELDLGPVYTVDKLKKKCVIIVRHNVYREDRLSGEALGPGQVVIGPDNKAYQYHPAQRARCVSSGVGPITITAATNDVVVLALEGGADQSIQLTAGADRTFAEIAAEANVTLIPEKIRLYVDADGHLVAESMEHHKTLEVKAGSNTIHADLAWTEQVYWFAGASHDPSLVNGVNLTVTSGADETIQTLEE